MGPAIPARARPSGHRPGRLALLALAAAVLAAATPARALESDQYITWGRPIADSTAALDAWFNLQLETVLAEASRGGRIPSRREIERRFSRRIRFLFIVHPPELWVSSSGLVERFPDTAREEVFFKSHSIYHDHGPLDIGLWMPIAPTVVVNGVRIGTDKLSHFVSLGWQLYARYRRLRRRGASEREAELAALRAGFDGERYFLLGYRTSGILSLSDMEADFEGMLFYRDLCGGADPVLVRTARGWSIRRPIDIGRYVTPEWDESYEPQIYRPGRWRKVKPVLRGYCSWLGSPWLERERTRYRAHDGITPVESLVLEMVAQKRLPDPRRFSLEAVCGRPVRPLDGGGTPAAHPPSAARLRRLERAVREDAARVRKRSIGLWRVGFSIPSGATLAAGVMRARLPAANPCRLLCSFRGPYAQAAAGANGMRLSLGYGRLWADLTGRGRFVANAFMGMGVRASLVRTWNDPLGGTEAGATLAGPEIELSMAKINLSLGALRRLDGRHAGDWLVTWGLGFGF